MKPLKRCRHRGERGPGPRLPLLYGSAATVVCIGCGKWKDGRDADRRGCIWRDPAELLIDIALDATGEER